MHINRYFIFVFAIIVVTSYFTFPAVAGDECRLSDSEPELGTPPLCRGRSVNALLSEVSAEPDFSNVNDIMQGARTILPVQDFVLMNPTGRDPKRERPFNVIYSARDFYLFTDNNAVTFFNGPEVLATNQCNPSGEISETIGPYYGMPSPQQTNPARMFNLDRDVVVTFTANSSSDSLCNRAASIIISDPMGLVEIPEMTLGNSEYTNNLRFLQSAVADFNGDGYDDILIIRGGGALNSGMFIISAVDPEDPKAGVKLGPFGAFPTVNLNAMSSPDTGDFNGDGILDVAWIGSAGGTIGINNPPYEVAFASICPGSTQDIALCQNRSEFEVILDPLLSERIKLSPNTFPSRDAIFSYPASALAAGDFNITNEGDELVIVYGEHPEFGANYYVDYYTFDSLMFPTFKDRIQSTTSRFFNVYAETGQFDFSQPGEQVVIAMQIPEGCPLWVLSFNGDTMNPFYSDWSGPVSGQGECDDLDRDPNIKSLNGLAVGRFTSQAPNNFQGLTPQIGVFLSLNEEAELLPPPFILAGMDIRILRPNNPPNDFTAKYVSNFFRATAQPGDPLQSASSDFRRQNPNRGGSFLKAGDLQGRSAVLGTPDVARVSNWINVNTIIGTPPMHTAYIQGLNQSEPEVNNFSVVLPTFQTSFTSGTTTSAVSKSTNKTSWTFSFEQSLESSTKFSAIPIIGGPTFQTDIAASANQTYDCNVAQVDNSYSTVENVLTAKSGFGDTIIYTESRKNIYFYPIIGQEVCTDGSDDCPPSEKGPAYYQISAPDQISTTLVNARTTEFYQPAHQPGNILTYPATVNQLLSRFSTDQNNILSSATVGFVTDNSQFNQINRWEQGQGSECTTGSTETISGEQSISFGFGAGILQKFDGPGTNVTSSFDFGQSRAISGNESSSSSTTDSIGIQVNKPDEFLNPDSYQYLVNSYIMGQPFPEGVWQSLYSEGTTENISSTGPLMIGFTSNMLSSSSGSWWKTGAINPYVKYPDIGLNFPARWEAVGRKTSGQQTADCRLERINSDKATCTQIKKAPDSPLVLWADSFFHLRGFFLQAGAEAIGPSQSYVYIGDDLNLSTRVYNMSLKQMAPTDQVKVQFYRQEWDNTLNIPIGDSVLISEEAVSAIPPFTDSEVPNWKLVSTRLNTAQANMGPAKYWVFWVLVYGVDENGNLIEELPGYGLDDSTFLPGDQFNSILDVPLEMVKVRESIAEVDRSFTNNVGFFKHAVYVAAQPVSLDGELEPTIFIDNVTVTPEEVFVGEEVLVNADVYSMDAAADGVTVLFHDRDPEEAERAYDIEMLSNIEKDSLHNVQVKFQPEFCGEHELHISAADNGIGNEGTDIISTVLNVLCRDGDTNLQGQEIGPNGEPLGSGGDGNCSLASEGATAKIPLYLFVPLLMVALRFGLRRLNSSAI